MMTHGMMPLDRKVKLMRRRDIMVLWESLNENGTKTRIVIIFSINWRPKMQREKEKKNRIAEARFCYFLE